MSSCTAVKRLADLDPRIPDWGTTLLERLCPFCDVEGSMVAERPDGLRVRRCDRCACFFVSPAPSPTALAQFYEDYSAHAPWAAPGRRARTLDRVRARSDPRLMKLVQLLGGVEGKSVLDIGFGAAEDLVKFRQLGANVRGVDLDPESVTFATERLGIDARLGRPSVLVGHTHDLVILHDVVEHELDPVSALAAAVGTLRPGGLLSIWTPNAAAVDEDSCAVAFRVDLEHMTYLSSTTVKQLAPRVGAEVLHVEILGHPALRDVMGGDSRGRGLIRRADAMAPAAMCNLRRRRRASGRYNLFAVLRRTT